MTKKNVAKQVQLVAQPNLQLHHVIVLPLANVMKAAHAIALTNVVRIAIAN